MKKMINHLLLTAAVLTISIPLFAFEGDFEMPRERSTINQPNPMPIPLSGIAMSEEQKRLLKTLHEKFKKEMDALKESVPDREEVLLQAFEGNRFNEDTFSLLEIQNCRKRSKLLASHLKQVMKILSEVQIEMLKERLQNPDNPSLGY